MTLDLGAVAREAAARWRQDRALLVPLAGLLLFLPQWALLLLAPEPPRVGFDPANAAAVAVWQEWFTQSAPLRLITFLIAQWGQLTVMALYVGSPRGDRPTLGGALAAALALLPRYVLAGLIVAIPILSALLVAVMAPPLLFVLVPAIVYVLGRTVLTGPALLTRRPLGSARAVVTSWAWTKGSGAALAVLVGVLVLGAPLLAGMVGIVEAALRAAHLDDRVVSAALDAVAAAIAATAMLALAMSVGVLYRRLAR